MATPGQGRIERPLAATLAAGMRRLQAPTGGVMTCHFLYSPPPELPTRSA
jgi:hypothetical protein